MKKIYTILAGSFMSLLSFAGNGYDDGKLSITYAGNDDIRISVDGREYTDRDNTVMIDNLRPGYHTIKVYKKRSWNGWDIFGGNKNRDKVLYSNSMYIKSRTFVDVMINRFGRAFVDERRMDNNGRWDDDRYDDDRYDDDYDHNNDDWNNGYGNVIRDRDFTAAKEQIKKEWFENTRLTIAKQIIDANNFRASQVKEIVTLFTFENNKLEIAKYAYRKTVDKQNYFQVNDAFTFSSSKDELARFIRDNR